MKWKVWRGMKRELVNGRKRTRRFLSSRACGVSATRALMFHCVKKIGCISREEWRVGMMGRRGGVALGPPPTNS